MNRPFKLAQVCQSFPQRFTENTPLLFSHFAHHYTYFQVLRNLHRTASSSAFSSHSHSSPLDRPVPHLPVVLPPGSTWLCYGVWSASPDPRECDATPALSRDFLEVSFKRWSKKPHTDWYMHSRWKQGQCGGSDQSSCCYWLQPPGHAKAQFTCSWLDWNVSLTICFWTFFFSVCFIIGFILSATLDFIIQNRRKHCSWPLISSPPLCCHSDTPSVVSCDHAHVLWAKTQLENPVKRIHDHEVRFLLDRSCVNRVSVNPFALFSYLHDAEEIKAKNNRVACVLGDALNVSSFSLKASRRHAAVNTLTQRPHLRPRWFSNIKVING